MQKRPRIGQKIGRQPLAGLEKAGRSTEPLAFRLPAAIIRPPFMVSGPCGREIPMMDTDDFQALMARLRAGDEEAAAEVFNRFAHRLIGLARARLRETIRAKEDPEDVVQSVYRSFFGRHRAGQFRVDSWEDVWGILTVLTVRKCGRRLQYFRAARRDLLREVRLAGPDDSDAGWEAVAREPTPAEGAVLAETLEQVMRGLDGEDREILALHLQGYSVPEIGAQVGYSRRTVRRALDTIRHRLRGLLADPPEAR
jgi:RNA polymerase sigma-70 factor (ECF subfamily)